ncbi:uncharacterized protein ASCRUDRAFT_72472 [Ascoidea rubescens DSM 1968]|uniref:Uncharacterized protein n=1 Tax=Ascoidea rubescens DSM 1968 TaxID=1344418 RepID=A0A1D2VA60_9ASCO|nr:hypothetical protein ASCRUDRAFT_72472 [Ascoidea rubescens DSM 1968]ODV58538.1 hypothetical protein ASCRUDRAFT_72472 [Ascoidea rubescens DSM 1968]
MNSTINNDDVANTKTSHNNLSRNSQNELINQKDINIVDDSLNIIASDIKKKNFSELFKRLSIRKRKNDLDSNLNQKNSNNSNNFIKTEKSDQSIKISSPNTSQLPESSRFFNLLRLKFLKLLNSDNDKVKCLGASDRNLKKFYTWSFSSNQNLNNSKSNVSLFGDNVLDFNCNTTKRRTTDALLYESQKSIKVNNEIINSEITSATSLAIYHHLINGSCIYTNNINSQESCLILNKIPPEIINSVIFMIFNSDKTRNKNDDYHENVFFRNYKFHYQVMGFLTSCKIIYNNYLWLLYHLLDVNLVENYSGRQNKDCEYKTHYRTLRLFTQIKNSNHLLQQLNTLNITSILSKKHFKIRDNDVFNKNLFHNYLSKVLLKTNNLKSFGLFTNDFLLFKKTLIALPNSLTHLRIIIDIDFDDGDNFDIKDHKKDNLFQEFMRNEKNQNNCNFSDLKYLEIYSLRRSVGISIKLHPFFSKGNNPNIKTEEELYSFYFNSENERLNRYIRLSKILHFKREKRMILFLLMMRKIVIFSKARESLLKLELKKIDPAILFQKKLIEFDDIKESEFYKEDYREMVKKGVLRTLDFKCLRLLIIDKLAKFKLHLWLKEFESFNGGKRFIKFEQYKIGDQFVELPIFENLRILLLDNFGATIQLKGVMAGTEEKRIITKINETTELLSVNNNWGFLRSKSSDHKNVVKFVKKELELEY